MENQNIGPSSPGNSIAVSEFERDGLATQYEGDEDLMLLHMEQNGNEPISPNLKAVMEKDKGSDRPQEARPAPLLLERPQSSGLDVAGFSFGKPGPRGRSLLLQSLTKRPCAPRSPSEQTNRRGMTDQVRHQEQANSISHASDKDCTMYGMIGDSVSRSSPTRSCSPAIHKPQDSGIVANRCNSAESNACRNIPTDRLQIQRAQDGDLQTAVDIQRIAANAGNPDGNTNSVTPQPSIEHHVPRVIRQHSEKQERVAAMQQNPNHQNEVMNGEGVPNMHSLGPVTDHFRISKRRPANGKKVPSAKRTMTLASNNGGSQLSEEDLFQLLINRMRVREENEIAASNLQERMEADMSELAEENKTLKHQLETLDNQLQRSKCQTKTYRGQIENWKAKLVKFKGILNELGAEYRNLRNENLRLKDSKATLENERTEIESCIEDARRQISHVVALVGEKGNQLAESAKKIDAMTLALKNAEEKTVFVQTQLMEERRRSSILESYIHNNSRVQTKQLAVIRTEQQEMLSKLNSAFDILGQSVNSSQAATQTTLELTLKKNFSLLKELSEQLSRDRVDIQQCNDIVHKIFSSVNTFDFKLNEGFERTFALNENVAHNLREQLKLFENNNGCHMALLKQLGLNEEQYNAVRERLEALEPSMHKINSSLRSLNEKEIDLAQHITHLEKSISEGQTPALATDVCGLSMENAALKDQLEQLSIKMSSAEENAKAKELETEEAKRALLEVTAKMQEEMKRAQDFEAEAVSLRQKTISIETKIREELNRASVISRDQTKARFEQQIHKLLREKVEAEKDMATIRELLAEAQASMVINVESYEGRFTNGLQAEREHAAKQQRDELESMVLQREQQIQELEDFRTQEAARMSEQETELELLRKSEVAALAQQKTISQQLDEVQRRIVELNDRLSSKDLEFENLQKELDTCQSDLLEKEEELTQVKKELCAAESAKSNLETGKAKAKSEIHALLKRLQDSERWMKNIKEAIARPDDPSLGGPLPGTWDKLKDYLSSTDNDNPCCDSQRTTVPAAPDVSNATVSPSVILTPNRICESPIQGCVQMTEVIYRTQSFQGGGLSSPVQTNARSGNIDAVGHCERPESSTEIVPFSSIRQQLSPASGSSLSPEPSDLAEMLDLTPKNKSSQGDTVIETPKEKNEKGNAATSPKADGLDLGMIGGQSRSSQHQPLKLNSLATETAEGHTNATENQEKQKTVTFETENKATRIEKRKFSATVENPLEESASENRLVERPERTTKRTYSRFQRSPKSKGSPKFSNQSNASPASELSNRGTHTENQYTSNDKRARVSVAPSDSGTKGEVQGTADYLERRTSPARLASGSSRQSSAIESNPKNNRWTTRGARRGGRRLRSKPSPPCKGAIAADGHR
ncbi:hypothetical protein Asppvi_008513 [Aspergillus pseudoviridinutans]|uniref:Rootletin n=1 Tax=Aspergillus pseudoviridinutans TaxID=1517512 RepID=A0A9P3BEH3_9EURO|nr:uncharacterized protein Asppvi_008513 [Aspergillus pseudoviridinutans]GIJ89570.1 hypothetical protein Asppvi_008513 [Aspergillus pseudoviridinutans]